MARAVVHAGTDVLGVAVHQDSRPLMAAGPDLYAWSSTRASRIYHRLADIISTPSGIRYVMECGAHRTKARTRLAIGHRGMPAEVQRNRRPCEGCRKTKTKDRR